MCPNEFTLRKLLAHSHAGVLLYTDDGELQDNSTAPHIDFLRESAASIESKLFQRALIAQGRHDTASQVNRSFLASLKASAPQP